MLLVVLIAVEVAVAATVEVAVAATVEAVVVVVGARKAAAVAGISKMWLPVSRDLRVG